MAPWKALPSVGQQVFINYGDKSNEQLLLLYGAACPCAASLYTPCLWSSPCHSLYKSTSALHQCLAECVMGMARGPAAAWCQHAALTMF